MPTLDRFAYQPLTVPATRGGWGVTSHCEHDSIRTRVQLGVHPIPTGGGVAFVMDVQALTQVIVFLARCYGSVPGYRMTTGFTGLKPGEEATLELGSGAAGRPDQKLGLAVFADGTMILAVADFMRPKAQQARTVRVSDLSARRLRDHLTNFHLYTLQER